MKKVVGINTVNFGSTGTIMLHVFGEAEKQGYETYPACADKNENRNKTVKNQIFIGSPWDYGIRGILERYLGLTGFSCFFGTRKFLKELDRIHPDIIHLHNLHGSYINLPMLFGWIKKKKVKVLWTLHDCWAFTGHCPCFVMAKCDKWKTGCHHCPQYKEYPFSKVDNARYMYALKKRWFTGIKDMTLITPSHWLADLVKDSFLQEYPVKVIHNGIDLSVFQPTESDLRERLGLLDKKVVLGCADSWGVRKGLDVMIELARRLGEAYRVFLVGTDDTVDKGLPPEIVSVHRTRNQEELAKYYTMADVFANPTREDNFPTVNMEALACGTPVITFATGGSPESLDKTCGMVVPVEDAAAMEQAIRDVCEEQPFSREDCRKRAEQFNKNKKFQEYMKLYKEW